MSAARTILITGSSTGIGRATAELFQTRGWQVVATMRNPEAGKDLAALKNVLVVKLDVTDEESIRSAVAAAVDHFGGIDVLVNNAGYGLYGAIEAIPVESMRRQFETNVIGLLAMTGAVVPGFRKRGTGVIVNVGSIAGRLTLPFGAPYSGTKFAVEGISEALAWEMREIGVGVKLIEPGFIKTNFGNAREFINDTSLGEYQPLAGKLWESVAPMLDIAADPVVVAEVIYTAATDGTDQLRYTAGEYAKQWAAQRNSQDDATFFKRMRAVFDR